jgi:hypothetical protein
VIAALRWTIISLLLFVGVEAAMSRTSWYSRYLDPRSSAGSVESRLYWLSRPDPAKAPEILVVGDSRMAEGFSAPLADQTTEGRFHFWSLGIPGTTPRAWYYELRDADPTRRRFAKIAIAIDQYADEDREDDPADFILDLNFVIMRLRLSDCFGFAASMVQFDHKMHALSGCLFKGATLRSDLQAFLFDRPDRIKRADDWRKNGLAYIGDYGGRSQDLDGLTADFEHRTIHYPPGQTDATRDIIARMVLPAPVPQHGALTRYRERWLTGILNLYKDSPTHIVFFELARAPLPKPEGRAPQTWLHEAIEHPNVTALPQSTFRDLERPQLFFDGLHFNKTGRHIFTRRLAQLLGGA